MKFKIKSCGIYAILFILVTSCFNQSKNQADQDGQLPSNARIKTVYGDIIIELNSKKAPLTTERVKHLIDSGFYNGLTFHKVIPNYIIQTGDPGKTGEGGSGRNLPFEETNILHLPGTVSMARKEEDLNSADSQFFICLEKDDTLDGKYTSFGKVIDGLEIAKKINQGDKIITLTLE